MNQSSIPYSRSCNGNADYKNVTGFVSLSATVIFNDKLLRHAGHLYRLQTSVLHVFY
jgi:hypothetical protein